MKKRVADIIMEYLTESGIDTCFGVVGGGAMYLDNALLHCKKMRKVFNHHEQASAMAAEGYARQSGKMALVCVTTGPGGTNALTGVLGAWQDSIPMIVISGQVRYEISVPKSGLSLRYRGAQEFCIVPTVKHMTKYAKMIIDPLEIKRELHRAISLAMDGRRGPVWLDIPQDVQSAVIEENECYPVESFVSEVPLPDESQVHEVVELIRGAQRPCILMGTGIRSGGAMDLFYEIENVLKIPVVGAALAGDCCYELYPHYYGSSGNIGPRAGNFILQNADLIISMGNSLAFKQTGFNVDGFAPNAKIIMIDACPDEARKEGLRIHRFIHADLREFFGRLLECDIRIEVDSTWIKYCQRIKETFDPFEATHTIQSNDKVCAYEFWRLFKKYEPEDSIVVLGNNTAILSRLQVGVEKKGQRTIANNNCGSMGYDVPASLGAAVASGKRVICATGDGSIMMNIQELETIKYHNLPVHIIVFSNEGYGAIRQTNKNFFGGENIGCTPETGIDFPDFAKVAEVFGFEYHSCDTNGEIDEAVLKLFRNNNRVLLEVKEAYDDPVIPKLMSRINDAGEMVAPDFCDMYPFLEESVKQGAMYNGGTI